MTAALLRSRLRIREQALFRQRHFAWPLRPAAQDRLLREIRMTTKLAAGHTATIKKTR